MLGSGFNRGEGGVVVRVVVVRVGFAQHHAFGCHASEARPPDPNRVRDSIQSNLPNLNPNSAYSIGCNITRLGAMQRKLVHQIETGSECLGCIGLRA